MFELSQQAQHCDVVGNFLPVYANGTGNSVAASACVHMHYRSYAQLTVPPNLYYFLMIAGTFHYQESTCQGCLAAALHSSPFDAFSAVSLLPVRAAALSINSCITQAPIT